MLICRSIAWLFINIALYSCVQAQQPFVGRLVYSVEIADSSLRDLFPPSTMTIYTNDTLLRIETHTDQLGQQVAIQHIAQQKSYLLVQTPHGKYAIQIPPSPKENPKYTYKKKHGKTVVAGLKSKRLTVDLANSTSSATTFDYLYHKKINAKYVPGYEYFPGLLTDYVVSSRDGFYHHRLQEISWQDVSPDLFGIPSDFTIISMPDFVDIMTKKQGEDPSTE